MFRLEKEAKKSAGTGQIYSPNKLVNYFVKWRKRCISAQKFDVCCAAQVIPQSL